MRTQSSVQKNTTNILSEILKSPNLQDNIIYSFTNIQLTYIQVSKCENLYLIQYVTYIWLRYYATSRKMEGLSPDEVDFFQFTEFFQLHYCPGVDSASNRNEYQESSWG
jgi:hypothetical protein